MTGLYKRSAASLALAAAAMMSATPALAEHWGGRYYNRDRVSAGDVFAGILILGGIAAVASAASKSKRERQQTRGYPYPENERYREQNGSYGNDRRSDDRPEWSGRAGDNIDAAVNRCIDEVNRGRSRVEQVESVNRDNDGWRVSGATTDRSTFSCTIDRDGRIRNVNVGGQAI